MILPIPENLWKKVTQPFGVPNSHYQSGVHNGTDFACPIGTPIVAPCDGFIVYRIPDHRELGKAIYFSFRWNDTPYFARFLHLSEAGWIGGYSKGEVIGRTGNTGD